MQRKARLRVRGELELRSQQFLLIALVPGAAKVVRPSAFVGPRGLVVLIAIKTMFLYGFGPWLGPRLQRWAVKVEQERAATVDRLSRELRREPTDGELYRAQASEWQERRATSLPRGDLTNKRRE